MNTPAEIRQAYENGEIGVAEYWNRLQVINERRPKNEIVLTAPPSKEYKPLTEAEKQAIALLQGVRFGASGGARRFVGQLKNATELTPRQREYLQGLVQKYRRQIWKKNPAQNCSLLLEWMNTEKVTP